MAKPRFQKGVSGNPKGRPKGSKDAVPRTFRASIRAMYEKLLTEQPDLFQEAITRDLQNRRGTAAFHHVQLAAFYLDGKPKEQIEISTPEPITVVNRFHGVTPAGEPLALPPVTTPGEPDAHD